MCSPELLSRQNQLQWLVTSHGAGCSDNGPLPARVRCKLLISSLSFILQVLIRAGAVPRPLFKTAGAEGGRTTAGIAASMIRLHAALVLDFVTWLPQLDWSSATGS
jgi:hypothetical protein